MRPVWPAFVALLAADLGAQEEVLYSTYEIRGREITVFLHRESRAGKVLDSRKLPDGGPVYRLRATGTGTILVTRLGETIEIDREGPIVLIE